MCRIDALAPLTALLLLAAVPGPTARSGELTPGPATETPLQSVNAGIANGVLTTLPPSVAWLVLDGGVCTGTLIGCHTILSAAHCFCDEEETGATCQPPGSGFAFLQHGGLVGISSVTVNPGYVFGVKSDLAVVRLQEAVTNVSPSGLNTAGRPASGSSGLIVGFGVDGEGVAAVDGLKRSGLVETVTCSQQINPATHLCWKFEPPLGPVGQDSNTCPGDSGGPLFVDFGAGPVIAGVTSGGTGPCDGTDMAFDADVFVDRDWIQQQAGADLGRTCGDLAPAGSPQSPIVTGDGNLSAGNPTATFALDVPQGAELLRVTLNGPPTHDFDLFVNPGTQVSPGNAVCASEKLITLESCEIVAPAPGPWRVQAARFDGSGPFQLTATSFGAADVVPQNCQPDATTLCIDDQPGDRRFRITLEYDSVLGGGIQGDALATPLSSLGISRGGILAFTNPANPEVLVKVLNGCAITNHYWVFFAATTTVGFTLTVEDTEAGVSKHYVNPDQTPAQTVTDTLALPTCP